MSEPKQASGERMASLAIRNPVTVSMVFLSLVVLGVIGLQRIPLMLMPRLDAPVMFVRADYFNATPDQVLESITEPIEEAIATVPGIKRMMSNSSPNGMWIHIFCGMGADTAQIRADIREKIDQIRDDLPDDLRQIEIRNFSTDDIPILEGTLTANRDLRMAYEFLDARVKKPLERIQGIGTVELWGTARKQVDIYLRIDDIKRHGVDVGQLYRSVQESTLNLTLGRLSDSGQRYTAIAKGAIESVDAVKEFPIGQHGLVLSDVADVVYDQRPRNSGRHHNGSYAVGLMIQKTSDANTVNVVDQVHAAFEEWRADPSMEGLKVEWWHDSGKEIRNGLSDLLKAGLIGAALAIVVLFAFLLRLDASMAVGLAIPFSVATAIGLLYVYGGSLNILSMMGLMLAAGMLVDNAVVVLESIFMRLERGDPAERAARRGTGEVSVAVIAATSTTMIIFVPLIFDSESQIAVMMSQVGVSIILALMCSLFVSLTIIPLVAARLLRRRGGGASATSDGPVDSGSETILARLRARGVRGPTPLFLRRYLRLVTWHLDRRYVVGLLAVPAILSLAGWALVEVIPDNSLDASSVPSIKIEYDFSENYHYAKIERDFVIPVEEVLHANMDRFQLKSTSSGYSNNSAWTRAYLDPERVAPEDVGGIRKSIIDALPVIPGATIELGNESDGDRNWITANIFGDDPSELRTLAREARTALLNTEGFTEVFTELRGARDEVRVRLRRDVSRRYGISPESVSQILGITVRSQRMRNFRTPDGEVELWVGLDPADVESVDDLRSIVVGAGPSGKEILLGNVAELGVYGVPAQVTRENRRLFAEIQAVYAGGRMDEGRAAFTKAMDSLQYPAGSTWSFGFWTQQQNADVQDFLFNMVLALVMVYFVMAALFESVLHPFAIMFSLPFSVVGIVIFLAITGTPFNVMAQIGIILLIGIVVNNGIVLINHVNNLRREGLDRHSAILIGCYERLRPICMTAATTVVGLIPLAWGTANLMGMNYFPLARTVMGGLMASTALTLVILPTYYVILDDFGRWCRRTWVLSAPHSATEPASGD